MMISKGMAGGHEKLRSALIAAQARGPNGEELIARCASFGLPEGERFGGYEPGPHTSSSSDTLCSDSSLPS